MGSSTQRRQQQNLERILGGSARERASGSYFDLKTTLWSSAAYIFGFLLLSAWVFSRRDY